MKKKNNSVSFDMLMVIYLAHILCVGLSVFALIYEYSLLAFLAGSYFTLTGVIILLALYKYTDLIKDKKK